MPDLNDAVLSEAAKRSSTLNVGDLLVLASRHESRVSLPRERLFAYAERIEPETKDFEAEYIRSELADRVTNDREWAGENAVYEYGDDEVGAFPPSWAERLNDDSSVVDVIETITDGIEDTSAAFSYGGPGVGVPEDFVLDVASTLTRKDRGEANEELNQLYKDGTVSVSTGQHPNPKVWVGDLEDADADPASDLRSEE